ncbi:hypothetical protein HID58_041739, partial [Brassica napus]
SIILNQEGIVPLQQHRTNLKSQNLKKQPSRRRQEKRTQIFVMAPKDKIENPPAASSSEEEEEEESGSSVEASGSSSDDEAGDKEVEKRKGSVVVDAHLSSSREMALFFKAENVSVFGLDESTVSAVWDMVEDGPKKREMEEKLKKLKDMQVELCLQRTALLDTTAKMIFKDYASICIACGTNA